MITRRLTCDECGKEWQYVRARGGGHIPRTCKPCRELPEVLRRKALASKAERKRKAEARIDALEARLKGKSNG